jgi:ubiquinone/menaquinone biosynthesis C-methylase UbiE
VRRSVAGLDSGSVVLDLPCGGGTVLPLLAHAGFAGTVLEADLSDVMLERAVDAGMRASAVRALFVRCDALALPFDEQVVDRVVSINGLHCMPDRDRFLRELHRVLRPGGQVWMTTMVTDGTRRTARVNRLAQRGGVIPTPPPTREQLRTMIERAGFVDFDDLGGRGVMGVRYTRP